MENLLLVFDEIDDVYAMVGLIWRSAFSFLLAVAAFVATGFVFLQLPVVATFVTVALLTLGTLDMLRARRQVAQHAARNA